MVLPLKYVIVILLLLNLISISYTLGINATQNRQKRVDMHFNIEKRRTLTLHKPPYTLKIVELSTHGGNTSIAT